MNEQYEVSQIANRDIFCDRSKPDKLFDMAEAHYHNHYEIYFLLSGKRKYFIDNKLFNVKKGDLVLIPKRTLHKTVIANNSYHHRLLISFNDNMLSAEFIETVGKCFNRLYYSVPDTLEGQLEMILWEIEKEYHKNDCFSEQLMKGSLTELFAFLTRNENKFSFGQELHQTDVYIQKIATYVSDNYEKDITLVNTASIYSISPEHLSRKFKRITGFNFNEYLTLIRIQQAERLLQFGKLNITEIAERTGFSDSNYFSTVFKKTKGLSPLKYKNQLRTITVRSSHSK